MAADESTNRSLAEACALAVGGMVGGGIFVILGEAVVTSGNATFISLGIGGLLVLVTGSVYGKLTVKFNEPGGSFTFIEHITGPDFAGTVSWFLILGYIFTIALYGYAFGAYADHLLGIGLGANAYLSSAGILMLGAVNLVYFRFFHSRENLLSYLKSILLLGLVVLGFFTIKPHHVLPVFDHQASSIIFGSALVFVGYEGFQLLTYRYNEFTNHIKNVPKAIRYSISFVMVLYMCIAFVLTGSIGASKISQYKETALALIAEPILGQGGVIIVLVVAVFSTALAVLITIQALNRLAIRVADDQQLPAGLTNNTIGRTPVVFSTLITLMAIGMQFVSDLHQLTVYSSMVFLLVFSVVNIMGFKHRIFEGWKNIFPFVGGFGCLAAFGVLLYHAFTNDLPELITFAGYLAVLIIGRLLFLKFKKHE